MKNCINPHPRQGIKDASTRDEDEVAYRAAMMAIRGAQYRLSEIGITLEWTIKDAPGAAQGGDYAR